METSSRAFLAVPDGNSEGLREERPARWKGSGKEAQTRSTLTISAWIFRPLGAS